MMSLDLALLGNGTTSALVDANGRIVWACVPRFDGDPMFCALVQDPAAVDAPGFFEIDLLDRVRAEQAYVPNTPILSTRLTDREGGAIEIMDFMPRFRQLGRVFCPMMLVRQVRRTAGRPRVRIRLRPARSYGHASPPISAGSNHVRYQSDDVIVRLTTDASVTAIQDETAFFVDETVTLVLGPDESLQGAVAQVGRHLLEETQAYWREWVRALNIPFEWQEAVIRSAITLKLNAFEDTGAIVAAMTTSIPESPNTGRNWDYRFCWLRDGYLVVDALNRLGKTRTMERYLGYILNVAAASDGRALQPVYAINGSAAIEEREVLSLAGYRGMGPVRIGNQAYMQRQNDVYGSAILTATHVFFDRRLEKAGDESLFRRLETLGHEAAAAADQPDAGIWELRGSTSAHTSSAAMCWAGCDRLARIANRLGLADRAAYWQREAERIHAMICERAWNEKLGTFVSRFGGDALDAALLRLGDIGFLPPTDVRMVKTIEAIGHSLMRDHYVYRYLEPDDFGTPANAFLACTFWYIDALATIGRRDEAREIFERVLGRRNRHGLLAEHLDPVTGEQWGNFVQTYSMAGIIRCAIRLSTPWDQAV
jgi:GH15 family glucan-1,4-alpha-glucosidase